HEGGCADITMHADPLRMTPEVLDAVVAAVKAQGFGLVAVETLSSFWTITDENDNAKIQQAVNMLRNAVRRSGVPWLVHAHTRKEEGREDGGDLRGASALFAAVDLALFLKREGRGETTKRRLFGRGRWSVPSLVFDFDGKAYRLIGSEASVRGHE